jgi:PPOX class probable F420-dependent enzyme
MKYRRHAEDESVRAMSKAKTTGIPAEFPVVTVDQVRDRPDQRQRPPARMCDHRGMEVMSRQEWREFVLAGTRTAKAGFTGADGTPLVTPVWITLDGDDVVFTTPGGSLKHKALLRDPRITLCVDDQEPPYSYVMITGQATLSGDLTEVRKWAQVLGGRYMGADRAGEYGARNGVPGEYLVRVTPVRVVARRGIAS